MFNTFGNIFKVTSYGESHGAGIGVVIDGCPAGLEIDEEFIQSELDRRKPGQSKITTQRKESDRFNILSGVFEGKTTGTPINIFIKNTDQKSKDYSHIKDIYRPSHADFTYQQKYGIRDFRGGGRSSARITAGWVAAGAIAKLALKKIEVSSLAYVSQVGNLKLEKNYNELDLTKADKNSIRCPDENMANQMFDLIDQIRKKGDTIGGVITGIIRNLPIGLGEPIFQKFHAQLGMAMLSINAAKGFEIGSGFEGATMLGSEHNDEFISKNNSIKTKTNHSGGVQGGITNGEDVLFNVAFKPVATLIQDQNSVDQNGNLVTVEGKGRHDPCVLPRAVPIVESMASLVSLDFYLCGNANKM